MAPLTRWGTLMGLCLQNPILEGACLQVGGENQLPLLDGGEISLTPRKKKLAIDKRNIKSYLTCQPTIKW